ncbi:MAG: hypothetical protein ACO38Y_07485 [Steroidobacteraceae bacterium]
MLEQAAVQVTEPLINDLVGVPAALLAVLAAIFWFGETRPCRSSRT